MSTNQIITDLNDILFQYKNREYGAFVLRQKYSKFLSYATLIAIAFFVLTLSAPVLYTLLAPKPKIQASKKLAVSLSDLGTPESIDKKKEVIEEVKAPPLKSTVKFLPPVIKPDDQVIDQYIPTTEELNKADPGKSTQVGDPTGVDYSLMEVKEEEKVVEEKEKVEIFSYVEEMPTPPGGYDAFYSYVGQNIQYPEIAKRAGVEGKIFLSFVVSKSGSISDVQVVKGIGAGCDEEAVRVIRGMQAWNPGKQNGRPVTVRVSVPIIFKLQ